MFPPPNSRLSLSSLEDNGLASHPSSVMAQPPAIASSAAGPAQEPLGAEADAQREASILLPLRAISVWAQSLSSPLTLPQATARGSKSLASGLAV